VRIYAALGRGDLEHDIQSSLRDETGAGQFRTGFEYWGKKRLGGGVRMELLRSQGDLFGDSRATDFELFVHGVGILGDSRAEVPLRLGLALRQYELEDNATGESLKWSSFGPRVEVEPDIALIRNDRVRWSIYGRLSTFAGLTVIETDPASDEWNSSVFGLDAGIGTRLQFAKYLVDVGYLYRSHDAAESDVMNFTVIRAFDAEYSGLLISFGVVF